jgi:hypothetical protein
MLKRTVSIYRAELPDVRILDDAIVAEDKVVLRWRSEGTQRGELAGLAPAGPTPNTRRGTAVMARRLRAAACNHRPNLHSRCGCAGGRSAGSCW